jgi:hypothetical protein
VYGIVESTVVVTSNRLDPPFFLALWRQTLGHPPFSPPSLPLSLPSLPFLSSSSPSLLFAKMPVADFALVGPNGVATPLLLFGWLLLIWWLTNRLARMRGAQPRAPPPPPAADAVLPPVLRPWQRWRKEPVAGAADCFTLEVCGGVAAPGKFLAADAASGGVRLAADKHTALARWRFTRLSAHGTEPPLFLITSAIEGGLSVGAIPEGWDPAAQRRAHLSSTGSARCELFGVQDGAARQRWFVEEEASASEPNSVRLRCAELRDDGRQYLSATSRGGAVDLWGALDAARAPLWRAPAPATTASAGWRGSLFAIQARSGEFLCPTSTGSLAFQQDEALWRVQRYSRFVSGLQCYTISTVPALPGAAVRFLQKSEGGSYDAPMRVELGLKLELEGHQMWILEGGDSGTVTLRALSQKSWTRGGVPLPRRAAFLNSNLQLGVPGADSQWTLLARPPQPARELHDWDRSPGVTLVDRLRQVPFTEQDVKYWQHFVDPQKFRGALGFHGDSPIVAL